MARNEICPNCRSTYEIQGKFDFNANSISVVKCPVCTQEKWIPSGFPFPQSWKITGRVIDRRPVTSPPVRIDAPKENKPVYVDFTILGEASKVGQNISGTIQRVANWTIIAGVIVVLALYKDEVKQVIRKVTKK